MHKAMVGQLMTICSVAFTPRSKLSNKGNETTYSLTESTWGVVNGKSNIRGLHRELWRHRRMGQTWPGGDDKNFVSDKAWKSGLIGKKIEER